MRQRRPGAHPLVRATVPGTMLAAVLAAVLAGAAACHEVREAAAADDERIATMRDDPVFRYRVEETIQPGDMVDDDPRHNRYLGALDPWRGREAPDDPTADQVRGQILPVLDDLRDGGWTIVGARCQVEITAPDAAQAATDTGGAGETGGADPAGLAVYTWHAAGYRFHAGVPYVVNVRATFPVTRPHLLPTHIGVTMTAPFHADPATDSYLDPPPPALPAGDTCIARGEPAEPPPTGTGPETVTDGLPPGSLWDLDPP